MKKPSMAYDGPALARIARADIRIVSGASASNPEQFV
jgi:hypothetical protein